MMFDSGMPLGPGLLATWVPLPDPPTKNAKARINKAAIATSIPAFVLPLRSLFDTRFSFISSDCLRLISATGVAHFDGSGFRPIVDGVAGQCGLARLRRDQCSRLISAGAPCPAISKRLSEVGRHHKFSVAGLDRTVTIKHLNRSTPTRYIFHQPSIVRAIPGIPFGLKGAAYSIAIHKHGVAHDALLPDATFSL
jgi:hypothetical protein